MTNEAELTECPGEAHELDGGFNPSSQGPYGPGYHYCEVCDNEGMITVKACDQYFQDQMQNKITGNKALPS